MINATNLLSDPDKVQNLKVLFQFMSNLKTKFICRLKSQNFQCGLRLLDPTEGNSETHVSTKITNVMSFGPQSPAVMSGTAGTLQLNRKVKPTTYVNLNSSGLQVRKTTASYHDNPELRSQTFALKFSKDLA